MKAIKIPQLFALSVVLFLAQFTLAQKNYHLKENPELKVEGTSTLHDWEMVSNEAEGTGHFTVESHKISAINNVKVTMKAKSLKSGKSSMDNNTYEALKAEDHPVITFQLSELISATENTLKASGSMTIAGETRKVTFHCEYEIKGNEIVLKGETAFQLTDFNIEPPTAVFGTITTGNDVTISFDVIFLS